MQIETPSYTVVRLLLKGDDYEILCPNDEDAWYNLDDAQNNERLRNLLKPKTYTDLLSGKIDFIVCGGNW